MIRSVIIPAAGYGTRFLPITKTIPKEMLPLLNKPALQIIIEEAIFSGATQACVVINKEKEGIKHYFSPSSPLDEHLKAMGKFDPLTALNSRMDALQFHYVMQPTMRGLGDALLCAESYVTDDFFAVMLPDDIIVHSTSALTQLATIAKQYNTSVIGIIQVSPNDISSYGSIKVGATISDKIMSITDVIEKPTPEKAYSNYAIIGRYIFTQAIFDALKQIEAHANGEVQLTDAIALLAQKGHHILACLIDGDRFDIGRPQGWLAANNYFAHHELL